VSGFDPGVVNAYAGAGGRRLFRQRQWISDIIRLCNAGQARQVFRTTLIRRSLREFTGTSWFLGRTHQWGQQQHVRGSNDRRPLASGGRTDQLHDWAHDEVHMLSAEPQVPHVRFWDGFGEHYNANVFTVLNNLGCSPSSGDHRRRSGSGALKVVKAVLPDPRRWRRITKASRPASR